MIDFNDDEAMAAEYVLGTLDGDERAAAERRRVRDPAFEALVAQWEERLAPLAHATPGVEPPPEVFEQLITRLPVEEAPGFANDNILMVRRKLRWWRGVAGGASALAAALALWIVGQQALPPTQPAQTYVAVLQHGADQPSFVVSLDLANRRMAVMPLATSAPPGKSYQVWMIGGDQAAPRSMGVIDAQATLRPRLPDVDAGVISGATYAVTVEPEGGSPTGQPTSTPVFVGKLLNTSL